MFTGVMCRTDADQVFRWSWLAVSPSHERLSEGFNSRVLFIIVSSVGKEWHHCVSFWFIIFELVTRIRTLTVSYNCPAAKIKKGEADPGASPHWWRSVQRLFKVTWGCLTITRLQNQMHRRPPRTNLLESAHRLFWAAVRRTPPAFGLIEIIDVA